jgi:hypothetical protein
VCRAVADRVLHARIGCVEATPGNYCTAENAESAEKAAPTLYPLRALRLNSFPNTADAFRDASPWSVVLSSAISPACKVAAWSTGGRLSG